MGETAEHAEVEEESLAYQMNESTQWGYGLELPTTGADNFWTPIDPEADHPRTAMVEWLKGLEALEHLSPKAWATKGYKVGRRIPTEFRAPHRSIIANICDQHDGAVRREQTRKERLLEKLIACI